MRLTTYVMGFASAAATQLAATLCYHVCISSACCWQAAEHLICGAQRFLPGKAADIDPNAH